MASSGAHRDRAVDNGWDPRPRIPPPAAEGVRESGIATLPEASNHRQSAKESTGGGVSSLRSNLAAKNQAQARTTRRSVSFAETHGRRLGSGIVQELDGHPGDAERHIRSTTTLAVSVDASATPGSGGASPLPGPRRSWHGPREKAGPVTGLQSQSQSVTGSSDQGADSSRVTADKSLWLRPSRSSTQVDGGTAATVSEQEGSLTHPTEATSTLVATTTGAKRREGIERSARGARTLHKEGSSDAESQESSWDLRGLQARSRRKSGSRLGIRLGSRSRSRSFFGGSLSRRMVAAAQKAERDKAEEEGEEEVWARIVSNPRYTPAEAPTAPTTGTEPHRVAPPWGPGLSEGAAAGGSRSGSHVAEGEAGDQSGRGCQGLWSWLPWEHAGHLSRRLSETLGAAGSAEDGLRSELGSYGRSSASAGMWGGGCLASMSHRSCNSLGLSSGIAEASWRSDGMAGSGEALHESPGDAGPRKLRWGVDTWWFGAVLDPRTPRMRAWVRMVSVTQVATLIIFPCYLYALVFDPTYSCLYVQGKFAATVAGTMVLCDILLVTQTFLSLRMAFVPNKAVALSQVEMVTNARLIGEFNLTLVHGIWLDLVTFLPVAQLFVLTLAPALVQNSPASYNNVTGGVAACFALLLLQYLARLLYVARFHLRWQRVLGYIFSAAWWGFVLNLAAYLTCAHAFGSLWYLFTVVRMSQCYQDVCSSVGPGACDPTWITCPVGLAFDSQSLSSANIAWAQSDALTGTCFDPGGSYNFGIYATGVALTENSNPLTRIVYGNFFGLMTISSFGNALVPTSNFGETTFCVVMIVAGLLLFTLLIGNIQIFLNSVSAQVEAMQLRRGDLAFWLQRRQMPKKLKRQVMRQERQRFLITRGIDEASLLNPLPRTLRRDIKRHVCLDLVKKVPLFGALDACVLDSICERLEPAAYAENLVVVQQGEPVERMMFLIRGRLSSHHLMSSGCETVCEVDEGSFTGEELLAWGLAPSPALDRLPSASATLSTRSIVEAFVLSAEDLAFVTSHFAFNLRSKRLRHWIRYYSPSWRAWAAVHIQIAWRRHRARTKLLVGARWVSTKEGSTGTAPHQPGGTTVKVPLTPHASAKENRLGLDHQALSAYDGTAEGGGQGPVPQSEAPLTSAEPSAAQAQLMGFYTTILRAPKPESLTRNEPSLSISVRSPPPEIPSPPEERHLGQAGFL